MSGFVLTALAEDDLKEIWDYIAADNLDAADRVLNAIEAAFRRLADRPGLGHYREDLADHQGVVVLPGQHEVIRMRELKHEAVGSRRLLQDVHGSHVGRYHIHVLARPASRAAAHPVPLDRGQCLVG